MIADFFQFLQQSVADGELAGTLKRRNGKYGAGQSGQISGRAADPVIFLKLPGSTATTATCNKD